MVWTPSHVGIGIILAEILLRVIDTDPEYRKEKRVGFWWMGALGALIIDLDAVPAWFLGLHSYTFHHYFTHTFLAIGILFLLVVLTKFNPFMLAFFIGWVSHMGLDFMDNSISPLGPFDIILTGQPWEWGLLSGWGPMPCVDGVCGWASEYWLHLDRFPQYINHDLWTMALYNNWGVINPIEFMSYYDFTMFLISIPLILGLFYLTVKKFRK
jgi:hypothetical protein